MSNKYLWFTSKSLHDLSKWIIKQFPQCMLCFSRIISAYCTVKWVQCNEYSEMSPVKWVRWSEYGEVSTVKWVQWNEYSEMSAVKWVQWNESSEMSPVKWVQWNAKRPTSRPGSAPAFSSRSILVPVASANSPQLLHRPRRQSMTFGPYLWIRLASSFSHPWKYQDHPFSMLYCV